MKNEKLTLKHPWPTDIPEISECDMVDHNDYPWRSEGPKVPTCFYAQTFEIKDNTYLEIVFYIGKQLQYRMIFLNRDFVGQRADDLKTSHSGIEHLEQYSREFNCWYRGSKESAEIICKFFGWKYSDSPIQKIRERLVKIKADKLKESHDRIRNAVDEIMLEIKPIPKDFEKWVKNVPLKKSKYIFYDYAKKKTLHGICSVCHQDVNVIRPRNDQEGTCPKCKAKVIYKASGVARKIADEAYVTLAQKTKQGYVLRYFIAKQYFYTCTETMDGQWKDCYGSYRNPEFFLFESGREFEQDYRSFYIWENFLNTGEYRFCRDDSIRRSDSYLYGKNCKDIFLTERSNRKYFPFNDFCNHSGPIDVAEFLKDIIRIPQLEYLAKAKLYRLTRDISNSHNSMNSINILKAKKLWEGLGIDKNYLPIVQKENMSIDQIRIFAGTIRFGKEQALQAVRWLKKEAAHRYLNTERFLEVTQYTTPAKGIKYLVEQKKALLKKVKTRWNGYRYVNTFDIQREWIDYLDNASKLGYDLRNTFVLFPNHLPEAHDEMVIQRVAMEREIEKNAYKDIENIASELNKAYGMRTNTLFIRAPRNYKELTEEGQKLHHCVGTYAMRHATQETTILFIRKVEDPETPFYTLEYQRGGVVQVRGMGNISTTPEVQRFVDAWAKKINEKEQKQKQKLQLAVIAG